jgi:hypothetical protein
MAEEDRVVAAFKGLVAEYETKKKGKSGRAISMDHNYLRHFLPVIENELNQVYFIDFLKQVGPGVVPEYRAKLAEVATTTFTTNYGLEIQYGHTATDFYQQQREGTEHRYLFHGTRSTWEILDSWKLKANLAPRGPGIYFGRDYETSHRFASRLKDYELAPTHVASILVFDNKDGAATTGEELVHGDFPDDSVYEYKIEGRKKVFSLDSLVAIIFLGHEDVKEFNDLFQSKWSKERRSEFLKKGIALYDQSLKPLMHDEVLKRFKDELVKKYWYEFSNDPEMLFWPVGKPGWSKNAGKELYLTLLKHIEEADFELKWLKKVVLAMAKDQEYWTILKEVKRHDDNKMADDEKWVELLLLQGRQQTLLWTLVTDDHLSEYVFKRMMDVGGSAWREEDLKRVEELKQRLREWAQLSEEFVGEDEGPARAKIKFLLVGL